MPLSGGPSDKIGNRYERRWTVHALIELLQGTATSIRIEVPGSDGAATEFRRTDDGGHTWHQVKRQNTAGSWTIATLTGPGVIDAMWAKSSIGERFTFVSSIGVTFLTELTERACQARDYDEFMAQFITDEGHLSAFEKLRDRWKATSERAYNALLLIRIVVIDEASLQTWNVDSLRPWVDNPEGAVDILGQLIDDSVHKELTKTDVWERLTDRGINPAAFATDQYLAAKIDRTASTRLALLRPKLVNGAQIERAETEAAIAALEDHASVAILGAAGSGKSVVLASLIDWSRNQGRPTLVISADRLPAAPNVPALGAELGLGTSPVAALAAAARGKPATLIIDQLDAVSVVSGRNPGGTELIDGLLTEARSHSNIKVILACRQFDLDNDTGLRNVAITGDTQRIVVRLFTEEQVREAVAFARLPVIASARLLQLLQLPITLATYIEVSKAGDSDLTGARTLADLYNAYWTEKQRACPPPDQWTAVIDVLVDTMARNESLTVPAAVLDGHAVQRDRMISEGVLVGDANRIGFFHETYFDYAFARRFVGRARTIQGDLGDQDLFSRARVRQVLAYERSTDAPSYISDLNWLLHSNDVRVHLKALVLGLFETVDQPSDAEWSAIEPIWADPAHPLYTRLGIGLRRNAAWFEALDRNGIWERDLQGHAEQVSQALWLMSGPMCIDHGQRIAELTGLLEPRLWKRLRQGFHRAASANWSNHLDARLLEAIADGDYDADVQGEIWFVMHDLPRSSPSSAAKIIEALVRRGIAILEGGATDPFEGDGALGRRAHSRAARVLDDSARRAPRDFAARMVPLVAEIVEANARADYDNEPFKPDSVWHFHSFGALHAVADELLRATMHSIALLAKEDPDAARTLLDPLRNDELRTIGLVVAAGYAGNPVALADDAASWIEAHPGALNLGYSNGWSWASRQLIEAITTACSDATLRRLEDAVLHFSPPYELTVNGYRNHSRGATEFGLLNGIKADRRSTKVRKRLAELRRKFGVEDWGPPTSPAGRRIGAPIPVERAKFMSDEQWRKAIATHFNNESSFDSDRNDTGGAWSQAQVLAELTEQSGERFARLLLTLPANTNISYVNGILRGLAKSQLDLQLLGQVVDHSLLFGPDVADAVAQLLEAHTGLTLPTRLLDVLVTMIGHTPGPLELAGLEPVGLDWSALHTTAATALHALWNLIADEEARFNHVRGTLEQLASDSRPTVRATLPGALTPALYIDSDYAIRVFNRAVAGHAPQLLGSPPVEFFIGHTVRLGRFADIDAVITSMLASDVDDVCTVGARHLALASFLDETLDGRVDELLRDPRPAVREAAIDVFARSIAVARRERCVEVVATALSDPVEDVREAAGNVFHETPLLPFDGLSPLLTALIEGPGITEYGGTLALHWLATSRRRLPVLALDVCEAFVTAAAKDIGDIRTHASADSQEIVRIVLRLHGQHNEPTVRGRCLDLVDQLLLSRAHGIEQGLEEHDW